MNKWANYNYFLAGIYRENPINIKDDICKDLCICSTWLNIVSQSKCSSLFQIFKAKSDSPEDKNSSKLTPLKKDFIMFQFSKNSPKDVNYVYVGD